MSAFTVFDLKLQRVVAHACLWKILRVCGWCASATRKETRETVERGCALLLSTCEHIHLYLGLV